MLAYVCPACRVVVPLDEWAAHRAAEGVPPDHLTSWPSYPVAAPFDFDPWRVLCAAITDVAALALARD